MTLRKRIYRILDRDHGPGSRMTLIDLFLSTLIIVNAIAVMAETLPYVHFRYRPYFVTLETASVAVFTVEYLLRLWVCVERPELYGRRFARLRYMVTPLAVIDLLAILPFYLSFFVHIDLRFLRVLRLLRILKLSRYSLALTTLLGVLEEESSALLATFFIMVVALILTASGAYLAEHAAQPDKFGSIPEAMWWAIITLTSVGYGDVVPITPMGKVFGALVAVIGIGMAAIPAGILASGMTEQMRRRRNVLADKFRIALADGKIDRNDWVQIGQVRKDLGLTRRETREVLDEVKRYEALKQSMVCPHCGKRPDEH